MSIQQLFFSGLGSSGPLIEQIPLAGIQASDISIARNGEVIYASFSNPHSLFVSTDGGATWQISSPPISPALYFQGFDDGNTIWTSNTSYMTVFRTTDSGATWIQHTPNYVNNTGKRYSFYQARGHAASANKQIVYAYASEYYKNPYNASKWYETSNLYKSIDFGSTYNVVIPDDLGYRYSRVPDHILWCSNDGLFVLFSAPLNSSAFITYRTFDGFSTRSVIPNPPDNAIRIKGSSDAGILICNVRSGYASIDTAFYLSTDFGTSWGKISSIGTVKTVDAYDFDVSDDGKTLVVLGNKGITKYTNF